jgi:hypothetical protein
MSQPDFYAIFGVAPSATQEEIRAAHRELVKRYHPDIYSTSGDKARATERLREINAAYAVLGNVEKRRTYDASRAEAQRRPAPAPQRRATTVQRAKSTAPGRAAPRPVRPKKKFTIPAKFFTWPQKLFTFRWLAGIAGGVVLFMLAAHFLTRPPEISPVWVLLQRTEVEPAAIGPATVARGWERLGAYGVKAECARVLKTHVKADQEQGSQAVFDESVGTMAITVLLTDPDSGPGAKKPVPGQKDITKRIRHYECRTIQVRQPDSWLVRKLRQIGLVG